VEEEIVRLKTEPVSAGELDRARTYLRSSRLRQLQSSHARAALLAKYELLDGDPNYLNTELGDFVAVTPERIQQAAVEWLDFGRRVALDIVPAAQGEE
jgi:predicted Zn-dependent peptidase